MTVRSLNRMCKHILHIKQKVFNFKLTAKKQNINYQMKICNQFTKMGHRWKRVSSVTLWPWIHEEVSSWKHKMIHSPRWYHETHHSEQTNHRHENTYDVTDSSKGVILVTPLAYKEHLNALYPLNACSSVEVMWSNKYFFFMIKTTPHIEPRNLIRKAPTFKFCIIFRTVPFYYFCWQTLGFLYLFNPKPILRLSSSPNYKHYHKA